MIWCFINWEFSQVGHLGEAYDKWVHQPVVSKECPRFFGNDFCEVLIPCLSIQAVLELQNRIYMEILTFTCFVIVLLFSLILEWMVWTNILLEQLLTRTKWWVIPLVWLPVVCWFVSTSIQRGLTPTQAASAVAGGVFIWTLIEYTLHRFLFHMKTTSYWSVLILCPLSPFLAVYRLLKQLGMLTQVRENFLSGVTPCTFSFMAAITSTPWIDYDSFSPQLQQQFSVCQYVNLL